MAKVVLCLVLTLVKIIDYFSLLIVFDFDPGITFSFTSLVLNIIFSPDGKSYLVSVCISSSTILLMAIVTLGIKIIPIYRVVESIMQLNLAHSLKTVLGKELVLCV